MTTAGSRGVLPLLLLSVLAGLTAQQLLNPVLAPLTRELGLGEVDLGLVITSAAIAYTVGSLLWGRLCVTWGHRRVLLTGMTLSVLGMAGFAVVVDRAIAAAGPAGGGVLTAMLLTRSLLFGLGSGAMPVATLAYVGVTTDGEAARTRGASLVGAAQAVSLVLGPGLGGGLAAFGLLVPVYVTPVVLVPFLVAIAIGVPRTKGAAASGGGAALPVLDVRVTPFLLVGFLLFLSLGLTQIVLGFLVQDRTGLDPSGTATAVGLIGVGAGLLLVLLQGVVVPRLGWGPVRLLRTGAPVAAVGFALMCVDAGLWTLAGGMLLVGLGLGVAMPGYTAGPSLRVGPEHQSTVAGRVNATNGATFIVGPLTSTALYEVTPVAPLLLSVLCCLVATVVLLVGRFGDVATPVGAGQGPSL